MKEYLSSSAEVLDSLSSSQNGLSTAEAASRLEKNGKNKLVEGKKESMLHRFFKQLAEPMTIILLVAAAVSAFMEVYEGVSSGHFAFPTDVVIILAVVLINAILGVIQESKAEKAIEALQEIAAATSKVIRDGHQITVRSEDLVVGDVIVLEAGDAVPADARIIEDLGADSLDVVELLSRLEDEFGITIPDEDVEKLATVQDVANEIEKLTK